MQPWPLRNFYIVDFATSQIWMEKGKLREVGEILNFCFFGLQWCLKDGMHLIEIST